GDFGDVYGGLQCLNLAEEELPFPFRIGPVFQQARRNGCHADISTLTPTFHAFPDAVDGLVLFDTVLRPLGFKFELVSTSPSWICDRNKIGARSSPLNHLILDS